MSSGSARSNRKRKTMDLNFHCKYCPDNSVLCSICLNPFVNGVGDRRTPVKLRCNHHFHLDCIGTAFNAKGLMQCPNCRSVEEGHWMFASGPPNPVARVENPTFEPVDLTVPRGFGWELCPFEGLGQINSLRDIHAHESAGQQCRFVIYHLTLAQAEDVAAAFGITENSSLTTNLGQVHSYASLVLLSQMPSNPRYFWDGLDRGSITARHYTSHSYLNHRNLNTNAPSHQDDLSVYNADWIKPDIAAILAWMREHLEDVTRPVPTGSMIPSGQRQVARGDLETLRPDGGSSSGNRDDGRDNIVRRSNRINSSNSHGISRGGSGRSSGSRRGGGRRSGPRFRGGLR